MLREGAQGRRCVVRQRQQLLSCKRLDSVAAATFISVDLTRTRTLAPALRHWHLILDMLPWCVCGVKRVSAWMRVSGMRGAATAPCALACLRLASRSSAS